MHLLMKHRWCIMRIWLIILQVIIHAHLVNLCLRVRYGHTLPKRLPSLPCPPRLPPRVLLVSQRNHFRYVWSNKLTEAINQTTQQLNN